MKLINTLIKISESIIGEKKPHFHFYNSLPLLEIETNRQDFQIAVNCTEPSWSNGKFSLENQTNEDPKDRLTYFWNIAFALHCLRAYWWWKCTLKMLYATRIRANTNYNIRYWFILRGQFDKKKLTPESAFWVGHGNHKKCYLNTKRGQYNNSSVQIYNKHNFRINFWLSNIVFLGITIQWEKEIFQICPHFRWIYF